MNETPHVVNQPRKTKQAIRHGRERELWVQKPMPLPIDAQKN